MTCATGAEGSMNAEVNKKLEAMRARLVEARAGEPDEATAEAGRQIDRVIRQLREKAAVLEYQIKDIDVAWGDWDLDTLVRLKAIDRRLADKVQAERDYVYAK